MAPLHATRRRVLASVASVATIAGCLDASASAPEPTYGATDSPWPTLGHDRRNTASTGTTVPGGPLSHERLLWVSGDDRTDAPVYASERLLASRAGTESQTAGAFALEPGTAARQWYNPNVVDYTTPSVYGETALFSGDGNTFAVDAGTGTVHWRRDVGGSGFHQTHCRNDDVVAVGAGRRVVALDAYTGETRWRSPELGATFGLAADDDRVYVTDGYEEQSAVRALDWASGEVRWRVDGVAPVGYPVVSEGRVFHTDVGTGTLYAFDAATGETLWTYGPTEADAPPAVSPDGDRLFLAGFDEPHLHAVAAGDGSREWQVEARSARQPVVTGESVFLTGYDTVARLSRTERRTVDEVQLPGEITSPLTLGPRGPYLTARVGDGAYASYAVVAETPA